MFQLDIALFGGFEIHFREQLVTSLLPKRLQFLLAYLLLHCDRPRSRQQIAFLFWPESNEKQAHANLRKALHTLRTALPNADDYLAIDEKSVYWRRDSNFVLDVARFEALLRQTEQLPKDELKKRLELLQKAVNLYTGDLLPDCYDDWIETERQRLRQRFLDALSTMGELLESLRQYDAATRQIQYLLHHDPLHEASYRQLMRLYMLKDDLPNALRSYHQCAGLLKQELGVVPSSSTQAAYANLLRMQHEPTLTTSHPSSTEETQEVLFVGRHPEWQRLVAAWQEMTKGASRFHWILGEPGIGKTRLSEEFIRWVSRLGYSTAYARAYAAEGRLAFDPIVGWLRCDAFQRRFDTLEDPTLSELARLLPEILTKHPHLPPASPLTESWQRRRFFETLAQFFVKGAEPILLVLDDMQWCDQETFEWLHFLFRFAQNGRLFVLGTARPGEIDDRHPLTGLIGELRQQGQFASFELLPFDVNETTQLADHLAGRPLLAEQLSRLHHISEGNPLLVQEIMNTALVDHRSPSEISDALRLSDATMLPAKMQAIIEVRLNNLSTEARQLAAVAAIIGRSFSFSLLRQIINQNEETLLIALDELWQRRIVREQGGDGYDFSHDKIREVALNSISKNRRQFLHLKVAEVLESLYADNLPLVSTRIAAHYRESSKPIKAVQFYLLAVRKSTAGFESKVTKRQLEQGLALIASQPRTDETSALEIAMLLALGSLLMSLHGWGDVGSIAVFEKARQLCIASHNEEQLLRAQNHLRMAYGNAGQLHKAMELAESNFELAQKFGDEHVNDAHGMLGLLHFCLGNLCQAESHLEWVVKQTIGKLSKAQIDREDYVHGGTFHRVLVQWFLGYPDQALSLLQTLLALCEPIVSTFERVVWYEFAIMVHCCRHEWQEVERYARLQLQISERYEYAFYVTMGKFYSHIAVAELKDQPADIPLLHSCLDDLFAMNTIMHMPFMLGIFAQTCLRIGELIKAQAALDQAQQLIEKTDERFGEAEILRLLGEIAACNGNFAQAEALYESAISVAAKQSAKSLELRTATSLARWHQSRANVDIARKILTPIYEWFHEGHATPDLLEAKRILDQLNRSL